MEKLGADVTVSLNASSLTSLGKADTAIQAPSGAAGQVLAKNSATDNDVAWRTVEGATAVSYGPQALTGAQKQQARENIEALDAAAIAGANVKATPADVDFFTGVATRWWGNHVQNDMGKHQGRACCTFL